MATAFAYFPEDWASMRQAVWIWIREVLLDDSIEVVFAEQHSGPPAPAKPYVWISMVTPPVTDGRPNPVERSGDALQLNDDAGGTYGLTIDDVVISATVPAGYSWAQISNALISAVNSSPLGGIVTASTIPTRADGFSLEGATTIEDLIRVTRKVARSTEGEAEATFQVDVLGRVSGAAPESLGIRDTLKNSLGDDLILEQLLVAGWSVIEPSGDRRPGRVFNAQWEDRSGFDIRLRCKTRYVALTDWIEDAGEIVGSYT